MRNAAILALIVLTGFLMVSLRQSQLSANPVPVEPDQNWQNPVNQLGSALTVGESRSYRNLTIFPILSEHYFGPRFVTLDRAIKHGDLEVKEKGSGEVNAVRVRNNGKSIVFGLAGDMIIGAKQDRMLKNDVLIPSHSGWLEVEVYCTEHGRWVAKTEKFGTIERVATGSVRAKAAQTESQTEVWAGVAEAKNALGAGAGGSALQGIYTDSKVEEKARDYLHDLMPVPNASERTVGVLVAVGDEIICADVFVSHGLFADMWEKLLRSYIADALSREASGKFSTDDARRFIRALHDADINSRSTPGLGRLYRVNTSRATGSALVHDDRVIHLDLFPSWAEKEHDEDRPTPELELRRPGQIR